MARAKRTDDPTDIDLRLLRVFDAVVKAGSYTAAEVSLNKSKSSISMDIAALEARLGLKLCRRGRGGFALTDRGRQIHALTGQLFKNLHDFRDSVGRVTSRIGGQLTAVMDDNFPFGVQSELTDALRSFSSTHPDVFLTLLTSSPDHVTQLVLDGSADIAISAISRRVAEVTLHPLFDEVMTLYCGVRHPLYSRSDAQITRKALASYDCVDVASRQSSGARAVKEQMRIRARAGTIHSRMLLVLTGNFLAFLPQDFAREWVQRGVIRPLLATELSYRHTCYAVVKRDVELSPACERFLEELKRVFAPPREVQIRKGLSFAESAPVRLGRQRRTAA